MREVVLCAHDPGGYDVIYPVFEALKTKGAAKTTLFLAGPAGGKQPEYQAEPADIFQYLARRVAQEEKLIAVTGTSWNSDVELLMLRYCKEHGIPTISILDYWSNYKSRFWLGNECVLPDYYFVMDEIAAREAAEDGIDPSIMRIVGQPGLDAYVDRSMRPARNRKLLFLSQPLSIVRQKRPLGYTEFDAAEGILKAAASLGYRVEIKFHPKDTEEMRKRYEDFRVEGNLPELAAGYEAVVGMSTMGLLQCALLGIPVISYQPGFEGEDLCITNKLQITKGAFSYQELCEQLRNVENFSLQNDNLIWLDGKSTQRCVELICSIGGI